MRDHAQHPVGAQPGPPVAQPGDQAGRQVERVVGIGQDHEVVLGAVPLARTACADRSQRQRGAGPPGAARRPARSPWDHGGTRPPGGGRTAGWPGSSRPGPAPRTTPRPGSAAPARSRAPGWPSGPPAGRPGRGGAPRPRSRPATSGPPARRSAVQLGPGDPQPELHRRVHRLVPGQHGGERPPGHLDHLQRADDPPPVRGQDAARGVRVERGQPGVQRARARRRRAPAPGGPARPGRCPGNPARPGRRGGTGRTRRPGSAPGRGRSPRRSPRGPAAGTRPRSRRAGRPTRPAGGAGCRARSATASLAVPMSIPAYSCIESALMISPPSVVRPAAAPARTSRPRSARAPRSPVLPHRTVCRFRRKTTHPA